LSIFKKRSICGSFFNKTFLMKSDVKWCTRSSLMDSIVNPKMKTMEGEGVGGHSRTHNTLGIEGRVRTLG
jgi:hypothetical protein